MIDLGSNFSFAPKTNLIVVVWVELKVQLEPHPKVGQDAVPPVAGAEEYLRRGVPLLHAILRPAEPRSDSKVGILKKRL